MKNFSILAKIGVNGNVPTNCEFRLHDGMLFWHGAPKKFRQAQYDKFIWQNNVNLGTAYELNVDDIKRGVSTYLLSGIFGKIKDINFAEFGEVRTVNEKTSKFAKYGLSATPTPEPANMAQPASEPVSEPDPEPIEPTHTPDPEPVSEPATEPTEPTPMTAPEPIAPEPVTTPTPTPTPQPTAPNDIANAFAALTPLFSGVQANVQAAVMAQLQPIIDELKIAATTKARVVQVRTPNGNTNTVSGAVCADFDAMVQTLVEGDYVYLYGPAGCGKSFTAQQLAEAMGLQFYGMQQLLYEHQVVGFVDANGTRHETPFSEAYQHGGLVLLDEFDGSAPEAAICVNNALANGVIALPGLGNVKAHPDFHVVAAGNTGMTGATIEYTARQVLDESTIDRFMFVEVGYDERIELAMANGDQSVVDFAHDVRRAIEQAGLYALCSYRCIKRLANVNLQAAWGDAKLLKNAFAKSLGSDELRLIYNKLQNTSNRWAMALAQLF